MRNPRPSNRRGMALLTVLMLVAVMSTVAIGVLDDLRFGVSRAGNVAAGAQARWYALGAEAYAIAQLKTLRERDPDRTTLEGDWNGRPLRFPIDGGAIEARIADGGNCFNLNSLASGPDEAEAASEPPGDEEQGEEEQAAEAPTTLAPVAHRQFVALLRASGFSLREAEDALAAVIDWTDANEARTGPGFEDDHYLTRERPYRTGGVAFAEVSELRAVAGFDAAAYARLRPFLCALTAPRSSYVNVNTLRPEDAILIAMLTEGAVPTHEAVRVLERRPETGWESAAAFWEDPGLARAPELEDLRAGAYVRTRFFTLETQVRYLDAELVASALLEQDDAGEVRTRARRWTRDE